ncbi:MAG: Eco47II family restriction endonuclease [Candidatus Micrarchaeota archaeon]
MLESHKYVPFVNDAEFIDCVRHVCEGYPPNDKPVDANELMRNNLDPFKMVFDIINGRITLDAWLQNEAIRQRDKTLNNRIGEFHQMLLGKVNGWEDLGIGNASKVDLRKRDSTVFIELKNKFNTVNSDSLASVRRKLKAAVSRNPKARAYWAYILPQNQKSEDREWDYKGDNDPRIRILTGRKVYQLVTGNPTALELTWKALPMAISDVLEADYCLSSAESKRLLEFFETAIRAPQ